MSDLLTADEIAALFAVGGKEDMPEEDIKILEEMLKGDKKSPLYFTDKDKLLEVLRLPALDDFYVSLVNMNIDGEDKKIWKLKIY